MTVSDDLATLREAADAWPTPNRYTDALARVEAEIARLERENGTLREIAAGTGTDLEAAEAEVARLRDGLRRIRENAGSWHGPEGLGTGHARALATIRAWCDALLAEDGAAQDLEGDPVVVHPPDPHGSQAGLTGPSGSPTSPSKRDPEDGAS